MARKVRKKYVPQPYYGPEHKPIADKRTKQPAADSYGERLPHGQPRKTGSGRAVLRDGAAYDLRNKRPKRS